MTERKEFWSDNYYSKLLQDLFVLSQDFSLLSEEVQNHIKKIVEKRNSDAAEIHSAWTFVYMFLEEEDPIDLVNEYWQRYIEGRLYH